MSHLFVDVVGPVESDFVKFMGHLPLRKFARFNETGFLDEAAEFPVSELAMTLLGESQKVRVITHGQHQIIVETGSDLLYTTARHKHANRHDVRVTMTADYDNGFVVGGFYDSGRPYLWVGLKGDASANAVLRIETPDMPVDMNAALTEQEKIACSFRLHGHGLGCP